MVEENQEKEALSGAPYKDLYEEMRPNLLRFQIEENLKLPIDKKYISKKKMSGREIDFVNVTDLKDILDRRVGQWSVEIVDYKQIGNEMMMVLRLFIFAVDGMYHQDGNGSCAINHSGYGDTFSNAYAQAFRRVCETHGLGRELWRDEEIDTSEQPVRDATYNNKNQYEQKTQYQSQSAENIENPIAKNLSDLITAKQLGFLRATAREKQIDPDEFCQSVFNCKTDELSKKAASALIDRLKN